MHEYIPMFSALKGSSIFKNASSFFRALKVKAWNLAVEENALLPITVGINLLVRILSHCLDVKFCTVTKQYMIQSAFDVLKIM